MRLTRNFYRSEFSASAVARKNGIDNTIPIALMPNVLKTANYLQILRNRLCDHYKRRISIFISSGYRCYELNSKLKGSNSSYHMMGLAADINATGLTAYELAMFIKNHMSDIPVDQVILEHNRWVHVGLRTDIRLMRYQYLEAIWKRNIVGKKKVKFIPLK